LRVRIGPLWKVYCPSKFISAIKILNDFIEPFVQRAVSYANENEKQSRGTFTEALAEFTNDKTVLRDQLVNTLLAGRDTTAATLSWLFYELAYHPDVYNKLRMEVINTVGNAKPTYDDLRSMKYLRCCLNEGESVLFIGNRKYYAFTQ
jgi:cytochrome P450